MGQVFRKKEFTAYTLSLLSALKYTHYIPEIFSHKIRGTITLQIVGSLVHGVLPHIAVKKALAGYDLNKIINFTNIYKTEGRYISQRSSSNWSRYDDSNDTDNRREYQRDYRRGNEHDNHRGNDRNSARNNPRNNHRNNGRGGGRGRNRGRGRGNNGRNR